jgi:hypothetical protein
VLKIEEYFLPTLSLRLATNVAVPSWEAFGREDGILRATQLLHDEVLVRRAWPLRTFGVFDVPRGDQPGRYAAAIEATANDDHDGRTMAIAGGYFVGVEHVGPLATLGESLRWFYEDYLPGSPYTPRPESHLFLFDPRFSPTSASSILTFGTLAQRSTGSH